MLLSTFLNVFGLSVGAMSALFFAAGALFVSTEDLYEITSGAWDVERHRWGDSIAGQRADYIAGALLLLVSFGFQLAANLVPVDAAPSLFQPLGCAIAEIVAGVSLLLVCSVFLRNANAHATREKLRKMRAAEMSRIDSLD